ncbi:DUF2190 domain-containing protein [Kineococcus sp. T13]|nr:DUF2190 domain-containing protein [Kineococcus vitellinus]
MQNECIPFYRPGADLTAIAITAVIGKRCVKISGNRQTSPGAAGPLATSVGTGNVSIGHADAGGRIFGVAKWDAALTDIQGGMVGVIRGPGNVVPITCSANITAFQEVEVTTNGQVGPKNTGVAIGFALTAAASGTDAQISLY